MRPFISYRSRTLLPTGLLGLGLLCGPRTAHASSVNDFSLGPELGGPQQGTFGPNTVIHFSGRNRFLNQCRDADGVNDFVYPAGDVYVVRGGVSPGNGATLNDEGGSPSTVIEVGSAGFQDEILTITAPGGRLGAGTYSVVFDTCQDGKFTAGEDDFYPDALSIEFPAVLPPIAAYIQDVKTAAFNDSEKWQAISDAFDRMLAAAEYVEGVACLDHDVLACLGLAQTLAADPSVQKYLEGVGKLAEAQECIGNLPKCVGLIDDLLVTPPPFSSSPRDIVVGGTKNLLANQVKSYFSVYLDPPRADFDIPASPTVPWIFTYQPGGSHFLNALASANPCLERQQALLDAFLTAIERYQGAQQAGRAAEALARVEEARSLAVALSAGLADVHSQLQSVGPALQADVPNIDEAFQAAAASHTRVSSGGFSPSELRALRNLGMGPAQIDSVMARALAYTSSDLYQPSVAAWQAAVAALATQATASGKAFDEAAAALAELAEGIREENPDADDAVPSISLEGPAQGAVGSPLTFKAQAPAGVSLDWDLHAFGAFEDGKGSSVKVSYRLPGARAVTVRASGVGLTPVTTTALVNIADTNAPPTLTDPSPSAPVQWQPSGKALDFAVTPSDPDGDPVSVRWQLDGVEVGSGAQWDHTFSAADWGQRRIQAIASDGRRGHDVSREFRVVVSGPDLDGDGWSDTPNGDCNDADPSVNPDRLEQLLNGKDDDCDPATLDAPPAADGEGSVAGGQVVAWGADLSPDVAGATPQPVTGLTDVTQVKVGLAFGWALRADGSVTYFARAGGQCVLAGSGGQSCDGPLTDVAGVGGAAKLGGVVAIDVDDYAESIGALRQDGSVAAWGSNGAGSGYAGTGSSAVVLFRPEPVLRADNQQTLTGLRAFELGTFNNWGLMPNGDVWAWGARTGNTCLGPDAYWTAATKLAFPAPIVGKAAQISDHLQRVIFLRPDGSVATCGEQSNPALAPIEHTSFGPSAPYGRAVQVLTSNGAFWVVNERGELYGWGMTPFGFRVFGKPSSSTPVPPFADAAGSVILAPTLAPLPPGPPVLRIAGEGGDTFHVVRADGSVLLWGGTTKYANGWVTTETAVQPTTLAVGDGFVPASDSSPWSGAAIVVPRAAVAADWRPPNQWSSVFAGPDQGDASGNENSELDVPLRLSHAVNVPVTVAWTFNGTSGSTQISAGATRANVRVTLPHDGIDGPTSAVPFSIVSVDAGVRMGRPSTAIQVLDIDAPPSVTVEAASFDEGNTSLTDFTVKLTLSQPSGWSTRARLTTEDDTAKSGIDYLSADLLVPFAPGELSRDVHLTGIGNTAVEANRRLSLQASGETNLDATPHVASLTIRDDDPVELVLTSDTVAAGATAKLHVSAPGLLEGESVHVDFSTVNGSAVSGADFAESSGDLLLTPDADATIEVATMAPSAEGKGPRSLELYVRVTPRNGERAALAPELARVTIELPQGGGAGGEANGGSPPSASAGAGDTSEGGATPSGSGGTNELVPPGDEGGAAGEPTGYAKSREAGGCACSFEAQKSDRAGYFGTALLTALFLRRRRRH